VLLLSTDKTVETDGPGVPEVKQEEQVLATTDNMDGVTEGNDAGGIGDAGDIGDTGDVSDTNTEIYAVSPKEEDEDTPHTGRIYDCTFANCIPLSPYSVVVAQIRSCLVRKITTA